MNFMKNILIIILKRIKVIQLKNMLKQLKNMG